jgi:hypothetical protein
MVTAWKCTDFIPNFTDKGTGCCITTTHHLTILSSPATFDQSNMTVIPHPLYLPDLAPSNFFLFPRVKIKLKGRHFDIIEVIEAESKVVLNTLTEHYFQDGSYTLPFCVSHHTFLYLCSSVANNVCSIMQ